MNVGTVNSTRRENLNPQRYCLPENKQLLSLSAYPFG